MSRCRPFTILFLLACAQAYEEPGYTPVGIIGNENAVITGELDGPLVIRCLAYGYPVPNVIWKRNGYKIPDNNAVYEIRGYSLIIKIFSISTLGNYTCQASNGIGKVASWSVLVCAFKPKGYLKNYKYLVERKSIAITPPTTLETTTTITTTISTEQPGIFTESTTEETTSEDISTSESSTSEGSTSEGSTSEGSTSEVSTSEGPTSENYTISESTSEGISSSTESSTPPEGCVVSKFGCCYDNVTEASGPERQRCPCTSTEFGCCPDGVSPAQGKDNKGCQGACKDSKYGCCSDDQTPAPGPNFEGCCLLTAFGCCPDNRKSAEGQHLEGCGCQHALHGCCPDNVTAAQGPDNEGCGCQYTEFGCCPDRYTVAAGPNFEGCSCLTYQFGCCPDGVTIATSPDQQSCRCEFSTYGCCGDARTPAAGPEGAGCDCSISKYGCCPDGETEAVGPQFLGCTNIPENKQAQDKNNKNMCKNSKYGCCLDDQTPAHGLNFDGCCLLTAFGCCPDNIKAAEGPHLEGCGCQHLQHGCCPDNVTAAQGQDNEGCGCQFTEFGCCLDRHTVAVGPKLEGCSCLTNQFGCCPDGFTVAKSPDQQSCRCEYSTYGCCGDAKTPATGPIGTGCDCSTSKYGCCPDGETEAAGYQFLGCANVPDIKQDACKLPDVKGPCHAEIVRWYYNSTREQCLPFRYGGCVGNANNFDSRELCQTKCEPNKTTDICDLPMQQGPCAGNFSRWCYNNESRTCEQFIWGGCDGNKNQFRTEAACQLRCGTQYDTAVCSEQQEAGNCGDKEALWSFSQTENRCVPFYYTGCGGNDNKFDSRETCEQICISAIQYAPDKCTLPAESGGCFNYRVKWFYDTLIQSCRQFYYGGCGGNRNNFDTERECLNACFEPVRNTTTIRVTQSQPVWQSEQQPQTDPEPDREGKNKDGCQGACKKCKYGCRDAPASAPAICDCCKYGCCPDGQTEAAGPEFVGCANMPENKQVVCSLSSDSGPCSNNYTVMYYYNRLFGQCSMFWYGGCKGNGNKFTTKKDCEDICVRPASKDACKLPDVKGPCDADFVRWYYNSTRQQCLPFRYGGCFANANNFDSRELCQTNCEPDKTTDVPAPPQTLRQPIPQLAAAEGGKVTLRCLINGNPAPRITWRRGEITINGNEGRYKLLSDGSLAIVSLYRNDTGVYICVADNGLGIARQEINLVVTDPEHMPAEIAGDENAVITGELDKPLVIRCLAYGYPVPDVFWTRDNFMMPFNDAVYEIRGNSLLIRSLSIETLGQYTCQAYNGIGKAASRVVLVCAYRPEGFFIEHDYLVPRSNITATRLTPTPTLETTTSTSNTKQPIIYFTVPVNVHLATTYSTLNIGTELRLVCEVDGFPYPTVYWTRDGQRLVPDERISISGTTISRLSIARVTVSDSGLYGCHAENGYSSHSDSAQINVQQLTVPAKCTDNPFFANCDLIVRSKFCHYKYYSKFCCKSCVEAGQLDPQVAESQADQPFRRK